MMAQQEVAQGARTMRVLHGIFAAVLPLTGVAPALA
jgi:hypothetical protein